MAKTKERSEVEHLRGLVKSLKSELRHLKKQVSRSAKRAHQYEDLEDKLKELDDETQTPEVILGPKCIVCGSHNINKTDLGIRIITQCQNCGKRETKKV